MSAAVQIIIGAFVSGLYCALSYIEFSESRRAYGFVWLFCAAAWLAIGITGAMST